MEQGRVARRRRVLTVALCTAMLGTLWAVAPSAGAAAAKRCTTPPVTMRLEAPGATSVGGSSFRVTDGVARWVPILPNAKADITDTKRRAKLEQQAAKTRLAPIVHVGS